LGGQIEIRRALASDLAAAARIYGHHAIHGTGTFDTEPPGEQPFAERLTQQDGRRDPFLVAVSEGKIAGFAYAAPFRPRFGWRFSYEDALYVAPGHQGQGTGTRLLGALIDACRLAGVRQLIALVGDSDNIPSLRVHARCGFAQIGTLRDVGFKHGRWLDVVVMQRSINP
jgi:L-amino acid N-acyltransferase YncA